MAVATLEHPCEVDRFQESYCNHIEHHCEVGKLQEFVPAQQPAGSTFFYTWNVVADNTSLVDSWGEKSL